MRKDILIRIGGLALAGSVAASCASVDKPQATPTHGPELDKNAYGYITVIGSLARDTGNGFTCYSETNPKTDIGGGKKSIVIFDSNVFCENNVSQVSKGDMPAQDFGITPDRQYPELQVITDMPVTSHPQ